MAGFWDFFSPGVPPDPASAPGTAPGGELMGFLGNPKGQAALLQAGLSLMGGPSWGDTPTSQIARAIGSGGEALSRGEAEDLKQQEAQSKQELRAAQASNAEARAEAAGARSGTAATNVELARARLGIAQQNADQRQERANLNSKIRLSGMYQNYIKDLAKRNSDPLRTGAPEVPLSMSDWVKSNPTLRTLGLVSDETTPGADDESVPAAIPSSPGTVAGAGGGSVLDRARAAIAAGAPRDAVVKRLRDNGIDPKGL